MIPFPVESAPKHELDHEPVPILLFLLYADIERVLEPTHWLPASPDLVVE